jgi:hypothetical protein
VKEMETRAEQLGIWFIALQRNFSITPLPCGNACTHNKTPNSALHQHSINISISIICKLI